MRPWHEHRGGACPTDERSKVRVQYRGVERPFLSRAEYAAGRLRWSHKDEPGDIIAYQVTEAPKEEEG